MAKHGFHGIACAALLSAVVTSGCHTYVQVERPEAGTPVRVRVPVQTSVEGSRRPGQSAEFEGTVVSLGDSLFLETYAEQIINGRRTEVPLDTVRVLTSELQSIEERVLSKTRSTLLAVALVGGSVALAATLTGVISGDDESDDPGEGGDTESFRVSKGFPRSIPLFAIRIPIPWP